MRSGSSRDRRHQALPVSAAGARVRIAAGVSCGSVPADACFVAWSAAYLVTAHRYGCLIGNGLSIAYNQSLSMRELTASLVAEFSALSGSDAEETLSAFAKGFGGYKEGDFESLIGPLESVSEALSHLGGLRALADDAPDQIDAALTTASHFVQMLYRVGFGTTLGLIAERAHGEGVSRFNEVVVATCEAIARLAPDGCTVVGTLNYDGLLHAGFLDAPGKSLLSDLAAGYESRVRHPDGKTACTGQALRTEDDMGVYGVVLLNLHGSLSWLANPNTRAAWKFELESLRAMDYWNALRRGAALLVPVVVLTNRKLETTLSWPFSLAYEAFENRMSEADRWLVAGYRFGDEPVNRALRRAAYLRTLRDQEPPQLLVVTAGRSGSHFRASVARDSGVPQTSVIVESSGLPVATTSDAWRSWSS